MLLFNFRLMPCSREDLSCKDIAKKILRAILVNVIQEIPIRNTVLRWLNKTSYCGNLVSLFVEENFSVWFAFLGFSD